MADSTVEVAYDLKANTGIAVIRFTLDPQLQKDTLTDGVIKHHILTQQLGPLCMDAAHQCLHDPEGKKLDEELAKRQAELEAEFARKRATVGKVSSMEDVVNTANKQLAATKLAQQAADEAANRDLKVAAERARIAEEATAAAIAELTTPMEVSPG